MSVRAIEAARAFIRISADDGPLKATLAGLKGQLSAASNQFSAIGPAAGLSAAGIAAAGLATVALAANAERTAVSFEVLLGSASKASQILGQINTLAAESPFGSSDFQAAAGVLANFGVEADDLLPSLRMLGDVASGDAEKLSRLALVFGQVSAGGRLTGGDVLQMINSGFNPLQQIAERTGESMLALRDRMAAGAISFAEVKGAFQDATSAGGRFGGMTQRLSTTTLGIFSTLKDEIETLARTIGKDLLPAANVALNVARGLVAAFSGWGGAIVKIGVAAGVFAGSLAVMATALMAYAKAAAIAAAFSGPKGWIMLAGAGLAAVGALVALDLASDNVAQGFQQAHAPLDTMTKDVVELNNVLPVAVQNLEDLSKVADDVNGKVADMQSPLQKTIGDIDEFRKALEKVGGSPKLVDQFREKQSGYTDQIRAVTDEIRILTGEVTEAELAMQQMSDAGVDPGKIAALRALTAERDKLQRDQQTREATAQKILNAQADAQREKEAKAAAFQQSLSQSVSRSNQDLRSVSGAGQITSLVNGSMDAQKQALITAQDSREELRRLRQIAEQEKKKGRKV